MLNVHFPIQGDPDTGRRLEMKNRQSHALFALVGLSLATSESGVAHTMVDPSHCSYNTQIDGFACPEMTIAGVRHTLSFWLYDELGASRQTFEMRNVASLRLVTDYKGTTLYSGGTARDDLTGHTDLSMTGLRTGLRVLIGNSVAHSDLVSDGDPVHQVSEMNSATNVRLSAVAGYPAGGLVTITYLDRGPTTLDGTSAITFAGGHYAKLTTTVTKNGQTGSSSCTIDLSTGIESC
jgi:hypothetical protein